MSKLSVLVLFLILHSIAARQEDRSRDMKNPLSRINIQQAKVELNQDARIETNSQSLGRKGETSEQIVVKYFNPRPNENDWIGVFSPANFRSCSCPGCESASICTAPIKYQHATHKNPDYAKNGNGELRMILINQRRDVQLGLFTGGLENPTLIAESEVLTWTNPKAPAYPRLAQGQHWDEMTVTWTSDYGTEDAEAFAEYGPVGGHTMAVAAGTLTFDRDSMCDEPARTVGWRNPGFTHTCFMKNLRPNKEYVYKLGHRLNDGTTVLSEEFKFRASPFPGQKSKQRVVIFGNMGKADEDECTDARNYQPGSRKTTNQLVKDINNIDMVFHLGDLSCAQGYLSQWDQFVQQIEPIASRVPYMIASGNQERDCPDSRSLYVNNDSGGECGVVAETMFYTPSENRAKLWYSTDFGMFRFCVANSELEWRKGSEQYEFIHQCLSTVDRRKQPWLIFLAHRVLGYSSDEEYALQGSFGEPMARVHLQKLLQQHKVDLAVFGHVQSYERTCPVYQDTCTTKEKNDFQGVTNSTINLVVGGGGSAPVGQFSQVQPSFSLVRDSDFGFVKLTAFNHSSLMCEYKRSNDGQVYDSFTISKDYRDILACAVDSCDKITLAS